MATIKELREEQARIATNARSKFDEIADDTPEDRAAEIEREFDAMMADHDKIGAKVDRLQKLEEAEARLNAADPRRPNDDGESRGVDGRNEGPTYREAFHSYLKSQGNVGAMHEEERAVLRAGFEQRAQTSGTTTEGGYTVPTEMANFIVKSMEAYGPMYDPGITMEMVTSGGGQITIPTVDDTSSTVGQHTEGATLTDDGGKDVVFGQKTLDAYAYDTEWLQVSKELIDDSAFNIEQFLGELLGERLARRVNTELTTGDGTGDPNGIVTASTKGVDAAGTGSVTADELIDLLHSVDPAYRASPRFRWMMNDSTLAALRKLKYGDGHYIIQADFRDGLQERMLGYPFTVNQAMADLGTGNKPILVGDFGKYIVRKVGQPLIGAIQDKDFWPGFGIAGYVRLDGELSDTAAVKHILNA